VAVEQVFLDFSSFSCQYHSTEALHTLVYHLGMNNMPIGDRSSETQSRPIDVNKPASL
jgi:hypothetical protein